jgi:hypothetical protein
MVGRWGEIRRASPTNGRMAQRVGMARLLAVRESYDTIVHIGNRIGM